MDVKLNRFQVVRVMPNTPSLVLHGATVYTLGINIIEAFAETDRLNFAHFWHLLKLICPWQIFLMQTLIRA